MQIIVEKNFVIKSWGLTKILILQKKIFYGIDNILEVSRDPCKNEKVYQVKYEELYVFSPKSISNKGIKISK